MICEISDKMSILDSVRRPKRMRRDIGREVKGWLYDEGREREKSLVCAVISKHPKMGSVPFSWKRRIEEVLRYNMSDLKK